MTDYADIEILDVYPARLFDAAETVEEFADLFESKAGAAQVDWLSSEHPWQRKFNWFCSTRADIQAARDFAARRQGKYKQFWVPTWAADFELLMDSDVDATELIVHDSGKTAIRGHVAVITPTAIYPRKLLSYSDNLDGTRTLVFGEGLPVALNKVTTLISYLSLARLVEDEFVMDFVAMDAAEIEMDWIETTPIPPFDDLGVEDFILWLRSKVPAWPSLALPADGTLLTQQNDVTGRGNHGIAATSLAKPRWDEDAGDGLPGVFFDANNYGDPSFNHCDRLVFPDNALVDLTEGEAFFCLNLLSDPPTNGLFSGLWQFHRSADSLGRSGYRSIADLHVYVCFGGPPVDLGIIPFDLTQPHIFNVALTPTTRTWRFNGEIILEEVGSFTLPFPRTGGSEAYSTLGADADAFGSMMGWEREFIFRSPVSPPAQNAAIHRYLASEFPAVTLGRLNPSIETLVVGGGGTGGWGQVDGRAAGGGGGGGCIHKRAHLIEPGTYPVVVGAGGDNDDGFESNNGEDSTFDTIVAVGGGHGWIAIGDGNYAGEAGGSGGGGSRNGGGGAPLPGNRGGQLPATSYEFGVISGYQGASSGLFDGTGGGGGGWGSPGNQGDVPGHGGEGRLNSITGSATRYGAGGAGGSGGGSAPVGGTGGGGTGGAVGGDGADGTGIGSGGGGGGTLSGGPQTKCGKGTAGIVVIRYKTDKFGNCTGGVKTTDGDYTVHTFFANGTFALVAA